MQLGTDAIDALMGGGTGKVTWGSINVVDKHNPSHNIGGGVRWLIYQRELWSTASWLEAYAYYAGFSGDVNADPVQDVKNLYETGLDPHYSPGGENSYLFHRSVLFP